MTTKNYNALAAEMMGWTIESIAPRHDIYRDKNGHYVYCPIRLERFRPNNWNPLQDRNQAHQLLKRAEALGILSEVVQHIALGYACEFCAFKAAEALLCPSDIITVACVDVWEEWQEEQGTKRHDK